MSRMRRRGGFSMVEAIIAMTVVVVVTMASITAVTASVNIRKNAKNKNEALFFAENIVECFKVSASEDEFKENVLFAEGISLSSTRTVDGYTVYSYDSLKNKFLAVIKVKYDDARPKLSVDVTERDGENIASLSYEKGGSS